MVESGQVYRLGKHRLMCGDSTDRRALSQLIPNGEEADLVFTDPPYGMGKEKDGVANDNKNTKDLLDFNKKWIPLSFEFLKSNGSWYCWGIEEPLMDIYSNILKPMILENKITFRNLLTWDKGSGQGQLSALHRMYARADEKCLFVMNGVQGFNTNSDNYFEGWEVVRAYCEKEIKKLKETDKQIAKGIGYKSARAVNHWWSKSQWALPRENNVIKLREYGQTKGIYIFKEQEYERIKQEYERIKQEYYSKRAYFDNVHENMNNVWHFDRAQGEERCGHATPKPLKLCQRAIKTSSRENEIVLDPFGGSGATLIACEELGRRCYMMELEPRWCEVIIQRWEKLTGKKAELLIKEN